MQDTTICRAAIKSDTDMERAVLKLLEVRSLTVDAIVTELGRGTQVRRVFDRLSQSGAIEKTGRCPATYRAV